MIMRRAFSRHIFSKGCSNLQSKLRAVGAGRTIHVTRAAQYKDAMPAEANQLLKEEGYNYLDVRTAEEFSAGHAPSAVNVPVVFLGSGGMSPNPAFLSDVQRVFPKKDEALVVGCKSGRRSLMAIDAMSQAGYSNLVNVVGGFDLWAAQGLPVER
ncbi:hypothetical protein VOLCADRAFT_105650 [Volvox carteri f. nagariensis]|uniref:Rhodanese domain-containing protein n=1 Tax=Volvox carteri f. nagariensis TaxID=3068 RepID=D8U237_VOLCA|nr:uncharacterized protein VOLCADRAFT_105650 [Volvox carteri f. nagariensis]EFJ46214.1 hypothetical protein VOLCADRAFT_105650 [Volvox carteri f. nagariensis]|eukprot:XP_002952661.1 hypothetical protein VOLCADRAFT_105650 [Volvox carteri f. nagariensis]